MPAERGRYVQIIQDLLARGVPLDGVGHQFHLQINADPADSLAAIDAVDALGAGLENHATEIDVSVYADPGTCFDNGVNCAPGYGAQISNLPAGVLAAQARIYRGLFDGFVQRPSVTSVTV